MPKQPHSGTNSTSNSLALVGAGSSQWNISFFPRSPKPYTVRTRFQASSSGGSRAHFPGHLHIIRYTGLSFSTHTAKNVVSVITTYHLRVVNLYQSTSRAYWGGKGGRESRISEITSGNFGSGALWNATTWKTYCKMKMLIIIFLFLAIHNAHPSYNLYLLRTSLHCPACCASKMLSENSA